MKFTPLSFVRLATPIVSIAGTLCLMMPANALGHEHRAATRQLRLDNPEMNRREIRHLIRQSWQGAVTNGSRAENAKTLLPPQVDRNSVSNLGIRIKGLNGQSTPQAKSGRTRSLANGLQLDLTSDERAIVLGGNLFANATSYTINIGEQTRTVSAGDRVTAAEYVAVKQIVNGGVQTLTVDLAGRATDGQFNLNSMGDAGTTIRAAELVIPVHVTANGDFARHADGVRVTNDLINYGSINALSSDRKVADTAKIGARDISNNAGATITTSGEVNLSLRAERDINNSGSISSSGSLELSAGRAINNSGLVSSDKSVTIAGNADADLSVNNTGGTIRALNGAINVQSADFDGTGNRTLYGGDLLSHELNLFSGQGTTNVTVNQLTGVVNTTGTAAHVSASTDTLVLGTQCLIGDPTYYNTGSIQITGDISVAENLAIIAGGDITTTNAVSVIRALAASNDGRDISIIAGANVQAGSGETGGTLAGQPPITQNTTAPVSFSGASATGGSIDFSASAIMLDAGGVGADKNAGNLTLAAYAASNQAKGTINLSNASTLLIASGGPGAGNNGDITIVAGGVGNAIQIGGQCNNGFGGGTGGNTAIATAQPTFGSGTTMTFDTTGTITTGNKIVPSSTVSAGSINLFSIGGRNSVVVHAGGDIVIVGSITAEGITSTSSGGTISIISDNGGVTAPFVSVNGGASASGGSVTISANDDSSPVTTQGIANGGIDGGSIAITNSGTGGVSITGTLRAAGLNGDGGEIHISTNGAIDLFGPVAVLGAVTSTGGTLDISGTEIRVLGGTVLSASGNTSSSLSVTTTTNGITTNGNNFFVHSDGSLALSIANNSINADNPSGNGAILTLESPTLTVENTTVSNPLVLSANGGGSGNGGQVSYITESTTETVIGQPTRAPKKSANFLSISAHAGPNDGNGGTANVMVGGDLTIDPSALDISVSGNPSPHVGATINLEAGIPTASKVGKLIILDDLNTGGAGGTIRLSSTYGKNFVIGATKPPKHGINGFLNSPGGIVSLDNGGGIEVASPGAVVADIGLFFQARGKGKIVTGEGVTLTSSDTTLQSENGAINVALDTPTLDLFTNSSAIINSTNLGFFTMNEITANKGFEVTGVGNIAVARFIKVETGGDITLFTSNGQVFTNSGAAMSAVDGSITLQASNISNGGIQFAHGVNVSTSGSKGGDITMVVGDIPKKPTNEVPDQFTVTNPDISVDNDGKGQTFFGVAPDSFDTTGSVSIHTIDKKVILNNGATNTSLNFGFSGANSINATKTPKAP